LEKVLNLDPDADDSRNLIIFSFMSADTFLVKKMCEDVVSRFCV